MRSLPDLLDPQPSGRSTNDGESKKELPNHIKDLLSLATVTLLGLPLITSLFRLSSSPCTHDGHLHYHRIAAMRHAWEGGLHFSRWLPDVAFGYGYPFFNYREAVPLYLSLAPHLLGLPLPAATNLIYALSILAAGWFMFLWVRDIFNPIAGILSAVAYMTAPYILIDALVRGNMPESLALPIFPLLLWAGRRFVLYGSLGSFLISTLGLAFLASSHNISLLLFVPTLFIYLVIVAWLQRLEWKRVALRIGLIFILGLGISAFYVGPALLELDEITISQSVTTRNNDWRFNFASLEEIFSPTSTADPSLLNRPLLIRLGLVTSGLALLGFISLLWTKSREQRGHILMMGLAAVGFLFMSLATSSFLWERVPLIEFVQFPWRLVGRAALPVAFLAGIPFANLNAVVFDKRRANVLVALLTSLAAALLILDSLPNLYPHYCPEDARPTINSVHTYEASSRFVGVDPEGSYFPKTVESRPAGSPLEADYQAEITPNRFDETRLPSGSTIESIKYWPTGLKATISSPTSFEAQYLSFAFPGWGAAIDDQNVPITPSVPEGLINFLVPAGRHTVEVYWGMTPIRIIMVVISLLSLSGVLITSIFLLTRRRKVEKLDQPKDRTSTQNLARTIGLIAIVALFLLIFKLVIVDRMELPFRREGTTKVTHEIDLKAAELKLLGFNLNKETVESGNTFDIDLAWQVEQLPRANYQSNVWLRGSDGLIWSLKETARPRIYESTSPTGAWLPGQWAWDSREVQVVTGTPNGTYDIVLTMFNLSGLKPITLVDSTGAVTGPEAIIGQIEVIQPEFPPNFLPQFPLKEKMDGLLLLGYNQDRQEAKPGEQLLLTLFWEKLIGEEVAESELTLELVDQKGQVAAQWFLSPVRSDYPPQLWQDGQRLRGQHSLRMPAGISNGKYHFRLNGILLGSLSITAPDRIFDEPSFDSTAGDRFEEKAVLTGYTIEKQTTDSQESMNVTLVWQGLAEMPVSYRVFVHLVNEDGEILAQSDGEPDGWRRPTTGWTPGEYIIDRHELTLPSEVDSTNSSLRVGFYDAVQGDRLRSDGNEFTTLLVEGD